MGITFDIIPMAPHESPEAAIARIYEGGLSIGWTNSADGWVASATSIAESEDPPWRPSDDWRDEIVKRLEALHNWSREDSDSDIYFWDPDFLWQVELDRDGATLRTRRDVGASASELTDAKLLRVFNAVPTVVHQPYNGWWMVLDELDDDYRLLKR